MAKNKNLTVFVYICIAILFIVLILVNYKSKNTVIEGMENNPLIEEIYIKETFNIGSNQDFIQNNVKNPLSDSSITSQVSALESEINNLKLALNIDIPTPKLLASNDSDNKQNIKNLINRYRENIKLVGLNIITNNVNSSTNNNLSNYIMPIFIKNYSQISKVLDDLENYLDGKNSTSIGGLSLPGF